MSPFRTESLQNDESHNIIKNNGKACDNGGDYGNNYVQFCL